MGIFDKLRKNKASKPTDSHEGHGHEGHSHEGHGHEHGHVHPPAKPGKK